MRKFISILLLTIIIAGCTSWQRFDNGLLQPSDERLDKLFPAMEIISSQNAVNSEILASSALGSNSLSTNSYLYTIWERELEQNIMDWYGEPIGSIEMVLINNLSQPAEIPSIDMKMITNMEFEVRIYGLNGSRVWKQAYSGESEYRVAATTYTFEPDQNAIANNSLVLFRSLIKELKRDLNNNYDLILSRLDENRE